MTGSTDLESVRRWESAGGSWYVCSSRPSTVTVSLCRCDGGEEVERLVSRDPALIRYVATRSSSEDGAPESSG